MLIPLDLQQYQPQLSIKREAGITYLYDPVRKNWLVLQPEELVRQLMLCHLIAELGYKASHLQTERGLKVHQQQNRRTDILAFDREIRPFLLVECKAPQVKLDEKTFWQAVHYNQALHAPFIVVTNGLQTYCCRVAERRLCSEIPRSPF